MGEEKNPPFFKWRSEFPHFTGMADHLLTTRMKPINTFTKIMMQLFNRKTLLVLCIVAFMSYCAAGSVQAAFIDWDFDSTDPDRDICWDGTGDETAWINQDGEVVIAINASDSANATVAYGGIEWINAAVAEVNAGVTQNGVTVSSTATSYTNTFCNDGDTLPVGPDNIYHVWIYNFNDLTITVLTPGGTYM